MNKEELRKKALEYHLAYPNGKLEVIPSKPYSTKDDLSLAYSPGVAEPCLEIKDDLEKSYDYTGKGNLVAVISNGTAVLGLGDIGALASKPVMEGKSLLFKIFSDINSFDIEINEKDPDKFIEIVKAISPTFGAINLEDIKAPECFYIEEKLKKELDIPIMHDDQHGTAIISGAALLNALKIASKEIDKVKIVINGAGSAAISCAKMYKILGAKKENIFMCDSKGLINHKRNDLTKEKIEFINDTDMDSLEDIIIGADVFLGVSKGNALKAEMLLKMSPNPIVFALANPIPEIDYDEAKKTRKDVIIATGRSDFPNQVNNVLGFPFIFRGALDVRAKTINEEMKIAAVYAISSLAFQEVPESVKEIFPGRNFEFGRDYFIPTPFDHRLITEVSIAVSKAAEKTGVARKHILDYSEHKKDLEKRYLRSKNLYNSFKNTI